MLMAFHCLLEPLARGQGIQDGFHKSYAIALAEIQVFMFTDDTLGGFDSALHHKIRDGTTLKRCRSRKQRFYFGRNASFHALVFAYRHSRSLLSAMLYSVRRLSGQCNRDDSDVSSKSGPAIDTPGRFLFSVNP
jgi:hypothetical protein